MSLSSSSLAPRARIGGRCLFFPGELGQAELEQRVERPLHDLGLVLGEARPQLAVATFHDGANLVEVGVAFGRGAQPDGAGICSVPGSGDEAVGLEPVDVAYQGRA